MKVIGQTAEGFIVDMSKEELARIAGHYSDYNMRDERKKAVAVGEQFNIDKMYANASATLNAYKELREEFKKVQGNIGKLVGFMGEEKA